MTTHIEPQHAESIRAAAQSALVSASGDGYILLDAVVGTLTFRQTDDGTLVSDVYTPAGAVAATYEVQVVVGNRVEA